MGKISGLAPIGQSGPIDDCVINGEWCPQQQALHGGQIPITGAMPGSKGLAEKWNLNRKDAWVHVGHGKWIASSAYDSKANFKKDPEENILHNALDPKPVAKS